MQHGLIDCSDSFIMNGLQSPAFVAAEAGYDVWLGNTRGNRYSKKHVTLSTWFDSTYWDHSFVEIAKYDLPAFIKYIRKTTKMRDDQKLSYIGHSQGTTEMFYGLARNQEFFNQNLNVFIALAPVARMTKMVPVNKFVMQILNLD